VFKKGTLGDLRDQVAALQMKTLINMYLEGKSFIKPSSRTCFECSLFASVSSKV